MLGTSIIEGNRWKCASAEGTCTEKQKNLPTMHEVAHMLGNFFWVSSEGYERISYNAWVLVLRNNLSSVLL
jgi:hypothetical protein